MFITIERKPFCVKYNSEDFLLHEIYHIMYRQMLEMCSAIYIAIYCEIQLAKQILCNIYNDTPCNIDSKIYTNMLCNIYSKILYNIIYRKIYTTIYCNMVSKIDCNIHLKLIIYQYRQENRWQYTLQYIAKQMAIYSAKKILCNIVSLPWQQTGHFPANAVLRNKNVACENAGLSRVSDDHQLIMWEFC